MYLGGLKLIQLKPEECLTVAAHRYELPAARIVGMQTAYIRRETEDAGENMEEIEQQVDYFVDGRGGKEEVG
ncbi:hypothetical protein BDZ45DRAFT_752411 [Acephala macrosclerotiorum]|nr:hypothetical protein BDZ45DRAFT_752411 [Acephala macrosclerotiorum]